MYRLDSSIMDLRFFGAGNEELRNRNSNDACDIASAIFLMEIPSAGLGISKDQLETMTTADRAAYYKGAHMLWSRVINNIDNSSLSGILGCMIFQDIRAEDLAKRFVDMGYASNAIRRTRQHVTGPSRYRQGIEAMSLDDKNQQARTVDAYLQHYLLKPWQNHPFKDSPVAGSLGRMRKNHIAEYLFNTLAELYSSKEGAHHIWDFGELKAIRTKFLSTSKDREGAVYQLWQTDAGDFYCSCPTNSRRDKCKHIEQVK
jgi:hypothetical protein